MKGLMKLLESGQDMEGTDNRWYASQAAQGDPQAPQPRNAGISPQKRLLARYFRQQGHTWTWIAKQVGCHESTLRRRCR